MARRHEGESRGTATEEYGAGGSACWAHMVQEMLRFAQHDGSEETRNAECGMKEDNVRLLACWAHR